MIRSVEAGRILDLPSLPTLSDGTAGGVEAGSITFELCRRLVDRYITVTEEQAAPLDAAAYVILFAFYFVNYFVIVFFNSALVACATCHAPSSDVPVLSILHTPHGRIACAGTIA